MKGRRTTILPGRAERSASRRYYWCLDCRRRVSPASYRAACPECDGRLSDDHGGGA